MSMTTDGGASQALLRCHGCGAVHPDRLPAAPGERTICTDCEDRAETDRGFDLMIGLAVLTDVPLYLSRVSVAPAAPGVH